MPLRLIYASLSGRHFSGGPVGRSDAGSPPLTPPPRRSPPRPATAAPQLEARRAERLKLLPVIEPPGVDGVIANPIDRFIVASWSTLPASERPDELCDDATFARRVYLDLIGVIPSAGRAESFSGRLVAGKADQAGRSIAGRKADYAAHWTPFWEDALASQTVLAQGGIPTHGNYRQWLLDSFADNKPYDVMVAELFDPSMPGRKKADVEEVVRHQISHRIRPQRRSHGHAANGRQRGPGVSVDFDEVRQLPRSLRKCRVDARSIPGLCRSVCAARPGAHPLRRTQRADRRGPLSLRTARRARCGAGPARRSAASGGPAGRPIRPTIVFAKSIVNRLWKRYLGQGLFEPVRRLSSRPRSCRSPRCSTGWRATLSPTAAT